MWDVIGNVFVRLILFPCRISTVQSQRAFYATLSRSKDCKDHKCMPRYPETEPFDPFTRTKSRPVALSPSRGIKAPLIETRGVCT